MRAATTEPWPARSAYRLDWSLRTPILMTPSDTPWACAGPAATTATSRVRVRMIFMSSPFLDSKVVVQLVHVRVQLRVRDAVDDAAVLHHVVTVRHGGGEPEVLFHEEDGEALRLQAPDGGADVLNDHRRQSFGRLIQQQESRAGA